MYFAYANRTFCWGLATVLLGIVGCADGPMHSLDAMNPWRRDQWAADERYAPTLHRQLAEVEALRASAKSMSEAQQVHWSNELKYILETSENPLLRAAAVGTLVRFTVPQSNEGLRVAMKDSDSTVREAVCHAWGERGGQEAVEQLAAAVGSDTNLDVRIAAARELAKFPGPMTYEALGLALDADDAALQYRAVQSLKTASGKDYGNNLDAWRRFAQGADPGPEYRPSLAQRVRSLF